MVAARPCRLNQPLWSGMNDHVAPRARRVQLGIADENTIRQRRGGIFRLELSATDRVKVLERQRERIASFTIRSPELRHPHG